MSKIKVSGNIEILKKWIKTLRSGKYKQTQETLKDSNGYCCIGVLANIVAKKELNKAVKNRDMYGMYGENYNPHYFFEDDFSSLCGFTKKMAKEKEVDFLFQKDEGPTVQERLIDMNDNYSNFKDIANYIEERFKLHKE